LFHPVKINKDAFLYKDGDEVKGLYLAVSGDFELNTLETGYKVNKIAQD